MSSRPGVSMFPAPVPGWPSCTVSSMLIVKVSGGGTLVSLKEYVPVAADVV
jgi:hypothetical protein